LLKCFFDFFLAVIGLLLFSPLLLICLLLIWLQDFHSPFYIAPRVGKDGKIFPMVKLRTMVVHAHKSGVDSTSMDDKRITFVGQTIRRFKIDELTQLWNVFLGQMSLVGPRPQVERDVAIYTSEERHLLYVRPGITDFASIVFADEGSILNGEVDPDLAYNQLIRPWKSRLGLLYARHRTLWIDIKLIVATIFTVFTRNKALQMVHKILVHLDAEHDLLTVCLRNTELTPAPPPGTNEIVQSRT
jgi:lipopolysaccharide/colanic/teichoic acid biosynthesis glycosyltransferase